MLREEDGKARVVGLCGYIGRSGLDGPAGVYVQRNRVRVRLAATSIGVGARALIGFVKQQSRLVRCAPGAKWLRSSPCGRAELGHSSALAALRPHAHSGDL